MKYGLTPEQVEMQLKRQNHQCAICLGEMAVPHIDHDHITNIFRGMLCGPCNQALGLFKEDPDRMLRAADYVRAGGLKTEAA